MDCHNTTALESAQSNRGYVAPAFDNHKYLNLQT